MAISAALSAIVSALTPKPGKPKLDSNRTEAFGIAGFTNTTGRGTPAFVPYGINRVWGHVISSGAVLSPDGKSMYGRILYFMGDTGGDGIDSIYDVWIDGTQVSAFEEISTFVRIGTDPQDIIPEFENEDKLYTPQNPALDFDPLTGIGTPVIYTTHGTNINRATLFFAFPSGLFRVNAKGQQKFAGVSHLVEVRENGTPDWIAYQRIEWSESTTSGMFKTFQIDFWKAAKWDIRVTVVNWGGYVNGEAFSGNSALFNVQETVFTSKTYPGWALLGLTNIPSKKIQSMENMNVSAVVNGKRVGIPDPITGAPGLFFTRKRCWIVRDMMSHPIVGMGSEISTSEIDDPLLLQSWYEAQNYYDEQVVGLDGTTLETRDFCDVIVSTSDWDWEWVKKVCGEARGRVIPSGIGWKYVVDKPGTANLLYAEGGNILDGSINAEIAPPDRPFSQITAQFRDEDKDYQEDQFSPTISDPEAVSVVEELFRYDTITRESEVQRENMIVFKRNFLERRRWQFISPMGAIVSEPMDLDYIAERGIGNEGAYTGLVSPGSNTLVINLPMVATLQDGSTYAIVVQHKASNTTEYREIVESNGDFGQVTAVAPFDTAPAESDIFALGIENVEHIITRAQELEIDRDGRVKQTRTEYVPDVYNDYPLPPKSVRRYFALQDKRLPIPLRGANVREEVAINKDGSARSTLIFDVTPGLPTSSGIAQGGLSDRIYLSLQEPGLDGYYNNAQLTITAGAAIGQTGIIKAYTAAGPTAFLAFSPPPAIGDIYQIHWNQFAAFGGFRVELSEDAVNWGNYATVTGTHFATDSGGAGPGTIYFRFTPHSENGVENTIARIIFGLVVQGDLSAPAPPQSVTVSSYLLSVRVLVVLGLPIAEDFNGVEIEIWRNAIGTGVGGVLLDVTRFGAPSAAGTTGTMQIEASFNLGARFPPETYGTVIWARARSVDFSRNFSAYVQSPQGTLLQTDPSITGLPSGPPSVPTGLNAVAGVMIDPVDGLPKPYLDIYWNKNPEPNIDRYEVHIRRADIPLAVTARVIQEIPGGAPQIGIREVNVIGNVLYEVRVQAINKAATQNISGFTPWLQVFTLRDTIPPGPAAIPAFGVLGGFGIISIFLQPPSDPDYDHTLVIVAAVNDSAQPVRAEASASNSISVVISNLDTFGLDAYTYYVWLQAYDTSGNGSPYNTARFNGTPVVVRKIGAADLVVGSAVITQVAQIQDAIIQDAHIANLLANKIVGGNILASLGLGVGDRILMYGPGGLFLVRDDGGTTRVQIGRLGGLATDYGMQIFGADGSLWYSFTQGAQTKGIADNAVTDFAQVSADTLVSHLNINGGTEVSIISASVSTGGGPVFVQARCRVTPVSSNINFNIVLRRNGTAIDSIPEITNNGKTVIIGLMDAPAAAFNTYTLLVSPAAGSGTLNSFNTENARALAVEFKK
jgi:hypothetical protein